jgi:4'-phosphopantetheinyl transferase
VAGITRAGPPCDGLLDEVEQTRAASFVRREDQTRFVAGAALLKIAVADHMTAGPTSVRVDRRCERCGGPHGRPRVLGSDLHVSVSHSGSLVAVALSPAGAVGIDIEHRARARALPPARQVLTPSEPLGRPEDLYTYWCRKESIVKATGEGWQVPCREVVVSRADQPARLVSYRGNPLSAFMADLDLGGTYAAAVTVLSAEDIAVQVRRGALTPGPDLRPGR